MEFNGGDMTVVKGILDSSSVWKAFAMLKASLFLRLGIDNTVFVARIADELMKLLPDIHGIGGEIRDDVVLAMNLLPGSSYAVIDRDLRSQLPHLKNECKAIEMTEAYKLTDDDADWFAVLLEQMPHLEMLSFTTQDFTGEHKTRLLAAIQEVKSLKSLTFNFCWFDRIEGYYQVFDFLLGMPQLECLALTNMVDVEDADVLKLIEVLQGLPNLKRLDLNKTLNDSYNSDIISALNPNLEYLDLSFANFSLETPFPSLPNLHTLLLSGIDNGNKQNYVDSDDDNKEDFDHFFSAIPNVRELDFSDGNVMSSRFLALAIIYGDLPNLKLLSMSNQFPQLVPSPRQKMDALRLLVCITDMNLRVGGCKIEYFTSDLTREEVQALDLRLTNDRATRSNGKCSICLEKDRDIVMLCSCKHMLFEETCINEWESKHSEFCETCIDEWANENETCPLCRQNFVHINDVVSSGSICSSSFKNNPFERDTCDDETLNGVDTGIEFTYHRTRFRVSEREIVKKQHSLLLAKLLREKVSSSINNEFTHHPDVTALVMQYLEDYERFVVRSDYIYC